MNGKNRRSNYNRRSKGWSAELCYTNENSQIIKTHPNENYVQYQTTAARPNLVGLALSLPLPPAPPLSRGVQTQCAQQLLLS